tara:strand:- start:3947 stop:4273 length:327 start_codon:yes stop_codon:yes gene_type:complete
MSTYLNVEVEAEEVISAMNEDGAFAKDVWVSISEGLHMGLLLDNCIDVISAGMSLAQMRMFSNSLETLLESVGGAIDQKEFLDQVDERESKIDGHDLKHSDNEETEDE